MCRVSWLASSKFNDTFPQDTTVLRPRWLKQPSVRVRTRQKNFLNGYTPSPPRPPLFSPDGGVRFRAQLLGLLARRVRPDKATTMCTRWLRDGYPSPGGCNIKPEKLCHYYGNKYGGWQLRHSQTSTLFATINTANVFDTPHPRLQTGKFIFPANRWWLQQHF